MNGLTKSFLLSGSLLLVVAGCGRSSIYAQNSGTPSGVVTAPDLTRNSSSGANASSSGSNATANNSGGNSNTSPNSNPPPVVRPRIVCTSGGRTPHAGANTISFTASECAPNILPDKHYVGTLQGFAVNGGTSGEFQAMQPANNEAPGVWFWAKSDAGNYFVKVTYLPVDDDSGLFFCARGGAIPATGGNQIYFSAADCGGHTPTAAHLAIPVALFSNGGTSGEFGFGQPMNGQSPYVWFWTGVPANQGNYYVSAAYIKKPANVVTCTRTAQVGQAGAQQPSYSTTDCNGPYPTAGAVTIGTGLASNGGTSGEFGFNGLSTWWWAVAGGGTYQMVSVFLE